MSLVTMTQWTHLFPSPVDTPLPIPNREVKHCSGEGSRKVRIARCWALFLLFNTHFVFLFLLKNL